MRIVSKKRFNADPAMFDKLGRMKFWHSMSLVLAVVCIVLFFVFGEKQEATWLREEYEKFKTIKFLCLGVGVFEGILSSFTIYDAHKTEKKLSRSYIEVGDSGVSGVCFNHKSDLIGYSFYVSYDELEYASALPIADDGSNIIIKTDTGCCYYGYYIENNETAVALIKDRFNKYHENKLSEETAKRSEEKQGSEKYCMYCGTKLAEHAAFCTECGQKVQ